MGITDEKLLFCHGISEESVDRKILIGDYNIRTVYDFFNNTFTADFGIAYLNLPPITIDDRPNPQKIARYTPDMHPYAISVASKKYVITLTTPYDSPQLLTFWWY